MDLNELVMETFGLSEEDLQKIHEMDYMNIEDVFVDHHKARRDFLIAFMGKLFSEINGEISEIDTWLDKDVHLQKIKLRLEVIKLLREEVRNGGDV